MKRILPILGAVWLSLGMAWAQHAPIPEPMSPPRLVNDYAGLFSADQRRVLEDSLVAFDKATSTQIAVVTVTDLKGYAPSQYATDLLHTWGVGREGKDNGVVLLLKPRNQYGKGEVFIAVGYGLEGALTDLQAGRIIDREMIGALSREDYYTAVEKGTAAIRAVVRGEYTNGQDDEEAFMWVDFGISLLIMLVIVALVIRAYKRRGDDDDSNDSGGRRARTIFFPPIIGGGGGSRGGGGFGGFGGFGGGRGGGGGAGRSF